MTTTLPKKTWKVPTDEDLREIVNNDATEKVRIKITAQLTEDMLGTIPNNKQIFTDFISEKMGDFQGKPLKTMEELDEETDTVPEPDAEEELRKATTSFHRDENGIFLYNYMLLGNIKSNVYCLMCNGFGKVLSYKKCCDLFVKVFPRKIRLYREEVLLEPDGSIERSIRAQSPKGERTFLGKSDIVNSGTKLKFEVELYKNDKGLTPEYLVNALKFGAQNGIGQWRGSGGYGKYKILSLKYVK